MNEDDNQVLSVNRIKQSLESVNFVSTNKESAYEYVKRVNIDKDNVERFLSWLILTDSIPEGKDLWNISFFHIFKDYRNRLNFFSVDSKNVFPPLLKETTRESILCDISRDNSFLMRMVEQFHIPLSMVDDSTIRISRVLMITLSETPQYDYIQGFERFAVIAYVLSLQFVLRINLSLIEAEALASLLLRCLLQFSEPSRFLERNSTTMQYFINLDSYLYKHNPRFMEMMSPICSENFAAPWIGVLFADIHPPNESLLIWDYVLLNRSNIPLFIKALVSSHIKQIPLEKRGYDLLDVVFSYNQWNVRNIINESESQIHAKLSFISFLTMLSL